MFTYLIKKLEQEYHHLSLWYFVFFFYGIAFYLKSVDFFNQRVLLNTPIALYLTILFVLIYCVVFLRKKEKFIFSLFLTILFSFGCGVMIAHFRITNAQIYPKPITKTNVFDIEAKVLEVKPTIGGAQLILDNVVILNKNDNNLKNHNFGKIKVSLRGESSLDFLKNDVINLRTQLFPLNSALLPGGYDFGLYMYLNGITATGFATSSPKVIKSESGYFYDELQNIRGIIYKELIRILGPDQGNFVAAILIGETKAINKHMADNMRNSGIAHILSVSGLHLSLVAMIFFISSRFLLNCSNYLSYKINIKVAAGIISIIGSFGYLLLSGANIAATRAFIMTFFVILAIIMERSVYPLRSVMIAGACILLFSPEYVMHPSFQLSFSAVLCLISGYELYLRNQKLIGRSKGIFASIKLYVFGNLYSSFLGSIVTAPFVIYHFYKFATYSLLMNLLAVPLMSFFMMPLAIISLVMMPFNASDYSLKLLGFFGKIITTSAQYVVNLPISTIDTGYITDSSMLIFTFGFFWVCLWQTTWRYFGLIIILISLVMMYLSPKPDFIYDHRIKGIGVKNKDVIDIYSKFRISNFTKGYWLGWYGTKKSQYFETELRDQLFESAVNGEKSTLSLNYNNCSDAEVQIMISPKLVCNTNGLVVNYSELIKFGIVLIFCSQNNCYAKFGQEPIWKIKEND
jgi:ComEC/Rec2-related protein